MVPNSGRKTSQKKYIYPNSIYWNEIPEVSLYQSIIRIDYEHNNNI